MTQDDYYIDDDGYYRFRSSGTLVHRWIAEKYVVERELIPGEVVHHKNGNKLDNRSENLEVMTWEEHEEHHQKYRDRKLILNVLGLIWLIVSIPLKFLVFFMNGMRKKRRRRRKWF